VLPILKDDCFFKCSTNSSNTTLTASCEKSAAATIAAPKAWTSLGFKNLMMSAACSSPKSNINTAARWVEVMLAISARSASDIPILISAMV
jgi:hypothetical protein